MSLARVETKSRLLGAVYTPDQPAPWLVSLRRLISLSAPKPLNTTSCGAGAMAVHFNAFLSIDLFVYSPAQLFIWNGRLRVAPCL